MLHPNTSIAFLFFLSFKLLLAEYSIVLNFKNTSFSIFLLRVGRRTSRCGIDDDIMYQEPKSSSSPLLVSVRLVSMRFFIDDLFNHSCQTV